MYMVIWKTALIEVFKRNKKGVIILIRTHMYVINKQSLFQCKEISKDGYS